ncbi:MAG: TolC family protein [bacterium]
MTNSLRTLIMLLLLPGGILGEASAQTTDDLDFSADVKLENLIAVASQNNPAIQAAEKRYRAFLNIPDQVSTLPDPMLSFTRWIENVETRVGPQENVFMLSQRIPFPGKLGLKGKIAGQDAEAARHQLSAVRRDVIFKVKMTYYSLYRIDRSLQILEQYLDLLRDFAQVATTKYATGQGIQAQVLKAHVEISNVIAKQLSFEKMRTGVGAAMNALLDRPSHSPIALVAEIDSSRIQLNEDRLLERAVAERQELLANQSMIQKAEFATSLAKKNYYPDFNIQATYITVPKVNDMFPDSGKDPFGIMFGINIPIWLGARKAGVRQADENFSAQRLKYENLMNQVEAEIADITFQIKTTGETLDLYERGLLIQAESSLKSATAAYQTGKLDFLNLLDAERMLLQLRLAYTNEQANYFKQIAALERAIGGNLR